MVIPIRIFEIERSNTSEVLFKMTEKMTYEQMVAKACESAGGKFMSRAQIKSFLTANFGYVNSAMAKNALKKALTKFERKGDSFRVSKEAAKVKAAAQKAKIAEKKAAAKAKLSAKKALAKEDKDLLKPVLRVQFHVFLVFFAFLLPQHKTVGNCSVK